jgi:hypothetical protein
MGNSLVGSVLSFRDNALWGTKAGSSNETRLSSILSGRNAIPTYWWLRRCVAEYRRETTG